MRYSIHILSFLLFISTLSHSQSYIPFPDSNYIWIVERYDENGQFAGGGQYFTSGKKTIDSITYTVILSSKDSNLTVQDPPPYWIGVRNDTMLKKVFMYDLSAQKEYLLYDFSLNVGDTVPYSYGGNGFYGNRVITNIDSTLIEGNYHKVFYVDSMKGIMQPYIEGIGSSAGPFQQIFFFEGGNKLRCTKKGEFRITHYTYSGADCELFHYTGITEYQKKSQIKVFPHPIIEESQIELILNDVIEEILVFDGLGKKLGAISIDSKSYQIGRWIGKPGIYYLVIRTKNFQHVFKKKIVKYE